MFAVVFLVQRAFGGLCSAIVAWQATCLAREIAVLQRGRRPARLGAPVNGGEAVVTAAVLTQVCAWLVRVVFHRAATDMTDWKL